MKFRLVITLIFLGLLFSPAVTAQDSLYAKRIDSLWLHSYNRRLLSNQRATIGEARLDYCFYKGSGKMRSITSLNKAQEENLIFFYLDDKLVMISPSGQQPYFILNDSLVYAEQVLHTSGQIRELTARAYNCLGQGYIGIRNSGSRRR
ncbi:MAG TPA: hypothetical protein VFR58_06915 [Flavisolibacter sp.]|nr:hypothetical protein [Flavisolibacter sp.]